jgi:hypothetical protein
MPVLAPGLLLRTEFFAPQMDGRSCMYVTNVDQYQRRVYSHYDTYRARDADADNLYMSIAISIESSARRDGSCIFIEWTDGVICERSRARDPVGVRAPLVQRRYVNALTGTVRD